MSICNFDQYCLCVFVYLCIYICVFESQTARNIVSEALLRLPFQKYSKCNVYLQLWPMLYLHICVFASQTPRNIDFEVLLQLPFQKYSTCYVYLQLWPMLYLCICVFVFVYLQVRHPGTLFLRSSYHYLFKNIAHVMSICTFDQCCICVFVYLCICICVFASQTPGNIVFEVLVSSPFRKYMVCMV